MLMKHLLFLPPALAVGWFGTRTALDIRRTHGARMDAQFMLILAWSPVAVCLISLLLSLSGSNP
jgi:hypothetical protein